MRDPIRLTRLFTDAPESVRVRVLRDAAIPDDRPGVLRGENGTHGEGVQWVRRSLTKITGPLLRYADLDDDTVAYLASEGSLALGEPAAAAAVFTFPFLERQNGTPSEGTLDLAELAASAALLQQLINALVQANAPFAIEATLPRVRIHTDGKVDYELAGGVLTAGAALAVTAAAGIIPAVLAASSAEAVFATLDRRGADRQAAGDDARSANPFQRKPASALVRRDAVLAACARLNVPEAYANHLLNRVLPVAARLTATGVRVEVRG
jgi:hypothetical protein